jgi:hypothetical protein
VAQYQLQVLRNLHVINGEVRCVERVTRTCVCFVQDLQAMQFRVP